MAVHVSVLRREWEAHRRAVRQELDRAKHIHTDRNLTREARERLATGFVAMAAAPLADALQAARETRREYVAALRAITPRRPSDPIEAMQAHRLLDQLHQLDDMALQTALADPAHREIVARFATPLDAQKLEQRMPQTDRQRFSVAAIREELAERDFPERIADHRRRLADVDLLLQEVTSVYSRLATGDTHQLAEELDKGDAIAPTQAGQHLLHHLTDDPRALAGAEIVWKAEVDALKATSSAIAQTVYRHLPMPATDPSAPTA